MAWTMPDPVTAMMPRNPAAIMAAQGRGRDTMAAHVSPGEIVLPAQLQTPEVKQAIMRAAKAAGVNPGRFIAGHPAQRRNPATGAPEFDGSDSGSFQSAPPPASQTLASATSPAAAYQTLSGSGAPTWDTSTYGQFEAFAPGATLPSGATDVNTGGGQVTTAWVPGSTSFSVDPAATDYTNVSNWLTWPGTQGNVPVTTLGGGPGSQGGGVGSEFVGPQPLPSASPLWTPTAGHPGQYDPTQTAINAANVTQQEYLAGQGGPPWYALLPFAATAGLLTAGFGSELLGGAAGAADASTASAPLSLSSGVDPGTTGLFSGVASSAPITSESLAPIADTAAGDLGAVGGATPLAATGGAAAGDLGAVGGTESTGLGGFVDSLFGTGAAGGGGGTLSTLSDISRIASPLISAAGLGLDLLHGNKNVAGQSALNKLASSEGNLGSTLTSGQINNLTGSAGTFNTQGQGLINQGETLANYLQTGTLPPGVQASIDQATRAGEASIRSRYAASGDSGSSAEAQDIQNLHQAAASQGATIATSLLQEGLNTEQAGISTEQLAAGIYNNLLSTGVSETGLSADLYNNIVQQAIAQNNALGQAIGNFATSLGRLGSTGPASSYTLTPAAQV